MIILLKYNFLQYLINKHSYFLYYKIKFLWKIFIWQCTQ